MNITTLEKWYLTKRNRNMGELAKEKCGHVSQASVLGATDHLCVFPHGE